MEYCSPCRYVVLGPPANFIIHFHYILLLLLLSHVLFYGMCNVVRHTPLLMTITVCQQVNFPLCTIAHTPRLPEHCIEYVRILLWPKEEPFGGLFPIMTEAGFVALRLCFVTCCSRVRSCLLHFGDRRMTYLLCIGAAVYGLVGVFLLAMCSSIAARWVVFGGANCCGKNCQECYRLSAPG